ncbi:MAG: site-specific DNA-methyltransferase, partial [Deltaproteobacteria bacterium]|nr:site-specific DNA-methyltransferase [Deltaproteobacteria bacterium]
MDQGGRERSQKVRASLEALRKLFPQCVREISRPGEPAHLEADFEQLRRELSEYPEPEPPEPYGLFWPGRREARLAAETPPQTVLRSARAKSLNFDRTENLYIEGDNLEVLKLLQKSYSGRVKLIYIDPPYNTGIGRLYRDSFRLPAAGRRAGSV